ncbi:MAG TPA: isochorismatase family cysteine hydrolase [Polyangiaceae bacterium]|nr:isochorismatase family cysteine hydrolase [Polyangiaceae bacterium]
MLDAAFRSALLVMDIQPGIIDRVAEPAAFLARATEAVRAARSHGVPVIHVVVGFRPGMPEVSAQNQSFGGLKEQQPAFLIDARPAITPEGDEVVVTKRRVSAFTGSDLEVVLRGGEIRHLVLCGIATSGVVLSTVREAADKDYRLTVLADLCADTDAEVHSALIGKVFPRQARVTNAAEWLASLA